MQRARQISAGQFALWRGGASDPKATLVSVVVGFTGWLTIASVVFAATIPVDTTADGGPGCSLRAAITAANRDAPVAGCPAGDAGLDTVELPAGVYTLALPGRDEDGNATGDLDVTSPILLVGAGRQDTIVQAAVTTGLGIDRVFHVHRSGQLEVEGVTVRHGRVTGNESKGGGLRNLGIVRLRRAAVESSEAAAGGGIWSGGSVAVVELADTVVQGNQSTLGGAGLLNLGGWMSLVRSVVETNSTVGGSDGGGLLNLGGDVSIVDSTFDGNVADQATVGGGGVLTLGGTLEVVASAFAGNTATSATGVLAGPSGTLGGGGILNLGASVTLGNSTFSANSADDTLYGGGGVLSLLGALELRNVTLAGNSASSSRHGGGGSLSNLGSVTVENSILSSATGGECSALTEPHGPLIGINNLIDDASCAAGADRIGAVSGLDSFFSDNGGATRTHALLAGSNAVDAGVGGCPGPGGLPLGGDQRGVSRPQGGACDIGAYELSALDFGDAPDPLTGSPGAYPTLQANDGARHAGGGTTLRLGTLWDGELDGQPDATASGDDLGGSDDEDGVISTLLIPGQAGAVEVTISGAAGLLNAWVDFDHDGVFAPGERIASDLVVSTGTQSLAVAVPTGSLLGTTFGRFRLDSGGGLEPTGFAADGEVEDYTFRIEAPAMSLSATPSPATLPEPGGALTVTLRADNTGSTGLVVTALDSGNLGSLDGVGSCVLPQALAVSGSYTCSYLASVVGNAGDTATDTFLAEASALGVLLQTAAGYNVPITDVAPAITVTYDAAPSAVDEPGGSVTFTARVDHLGDAEALTLTALSDDVRGDLDALGSCSLPQTLAIAGSYQCNFTATVSGNAGDSEIATVTAAAEDDEGGTAIAQASVTVNVLSSDRTPPVVTRVSTAGAALADCDVVTAPVRSIEVRIEDDATPIVAADALDNYLLVGTGPDLAFATGACGGAVGDDLAISFAGLEQQVPDPNSTEIVLSLPTALGAGLYRFLICDSVTDGAGNRLDGDGDTVAGGDFVLGFRADPSNLFANGHLDCDLDGWTRVTSSPDQIVHAQEDSAGSPESGSVRFENLVMDDLIRFGQCIEAAGAVSLEMAGDVRIDALDQLLAVIQGCDFFDQPACTGPDTGEYTVVALATDPTSGWQRLRGSIQPPSTIVSAFCSFGFATAQPEDHFVAFLDDLSLTQGPIFADGFESGDVSSWSGAVP